MISEYKLNNLVKPILNTYEELENELIKNIAENLQNEKIVKSTTKKLLKISQLDRQNVRAIAKAGKTTQKKVKEILHKVGFETIDTPLYREAYQKNLLMKNPEEIIKSPSINRVIKQATKETNNYLKLINNKARIKSKKAYKSIVNKAYIESSSGLYTEDESIRRALKELADKGISVATYTRKDGKKVNYSIEGIVRRDIVTKVRQVGLATKMEAIKEAGIEYVSVPAHLGARIDTKNPINNHVGWQGKIYKLNGSNKQHKNFYEETGYGEMLGLGGINCRHFFLPYIKGVSAKPDKVSTIANERLYKLEQQQRAYERDIRKWKRRLIVDEKDKRLKESSRIERVEFDKMKIRENQKKLKDFISRNKDLRRDYEREYVYNSNGIEKKVIDIL